MEYKLKWVDYFKNDGQPNKENWVLETGGHGFGNDESQYYTDELKNAFVKDGILNIVAYKEDYKGNNYTSAKLTTYKKHSIKYGKIVVNAKLPQGKGSWPAIWLLPNSIREGVSWPLCGEIDLMEHVGNNPNHIHFSLHSGKYNHKVGNQPTHIIQDESVFDKFNEYSMEWDEKGISFYFNGIHQVTFNKDLSDEFDGWPFDQEFYLIINLAIGGGWGGKIDDSIFPSVLQISSVLVYEKG